MTTVNSSGERSVIIDSSRTPVTTYSLSLDQQIARALQYDAAYGIKPPPNAFPAIIETSFDTRNFPLQRELLQKLT